MSFKGKIGCTIAIALAFTAALGRYVEDHPDALQGHGGISAASIPEPGLGGGPSTVPGIPAHYLADYRAAGTTCRGLDWSILAGIGAVETNHGQSHLPGVHSGANAAGARGPMQFLSGTFASVRHRHPDVGPDVYNPDDAIPAAAHLLCDNGIGTDRYGAIFSYNHAGWYVREVEGRAASYSAST